MSIPTSNAAISAVQNLKNSQALNNNLITPLNQSYNNTDTNKEGSQNNSSVDKDKT